MAHHAGSHLTIRKRTAHGGNVFREVIRIRCGRQRASDCRMRNDPLQKKLRLGLDAEFLREGRREGRPSTTLCSLAFSSGIFTEHGDAAISRSR